MSDARVRRGVLALALVSPLEACVDSKTSEHAPIALYALGTAERCAAFNGLPPGWRTDARAGMARVPGGSFELGSDSGYLEEQPAFEVRVEPFWIDRTEVTNAQFAAFVAETGYVTDAEREGGGAVFSIPTLDELSARDYAWWRFVTGANWRHPEGPGSDLNAREHHPVVLVSQADAAAYARWLGRRLPTEAEWEYAAKAGGDSALESAPFDANGAPLANFWQGAFPLVNSVQDGYASNAPVGCFPPNDFGLYDTIGNAWEWTADVYRGTRQPHGNGNPQAAAPALARGVPAVIKGGSHLCSADFCARYRASARQPQEADLPTSHVGFRTVWSDRAD